MNKYKETEDEGKEIKEYIDRFMNSTPEQILHYLGEARDFFYDYMTPEGKKYFESKRQSKLEKSISEYFLT